MNNPDYCIFDFETGGFSPEKNPALEIAMLMIDGTTLKEKSRWETFIKPYGGLIIEQRALDVNGLKMSDINKGLEKREVAKSIVEFFKKSNPKNAVKSRPIMVGHNVDFDLRFMEVIFNEEKKGIWDYIDPYPEDTLRWARRMFPKESSHKLGHVCGLVGINLTDAHKAMNDVVATKDFLVHAIKRLRKEAGVVKTENTATINKQRVTFKF